MKGHPLKILVGIDIGGTKISLAFATPAGKILSKKVLMTRSNAMSLQSVAEIIETVQAFILDQKKPVKILGIGLGVPGAINNEKGIITFSPNLPGWAGIPIKKVLEKKFKAPVFVDNDANVACLGEKVFGQGKKLRHFVYVTVSTGIGGGIVANGKLVHGAGVYAGEIGHMGIYPAGYPCNCGKSGCLEAHASGTAIGKIARHAIKNLSPEKRKKQLLFKIAEGDVEKIDAYLVSEAARQGNAMAKNIFRQMGNDLGLGLSHLIMLLNPEAIILGGSVSKAFSFFKAAMQESLRKNAWKVPLAQCRILKSSLGSEVADYGTIALVLENLK